jgi:hypothetical protein
VYPAAQPRAARVRVGRHQADVVADERDAPVSERLDQRLVWV